jgi:hypothetical protein
MADIYLFIGLAWLATLLTFLVGRRRDPSAIRSVSEKRG